MEKEEQACVNPIEEQRKSALEHYNDLATRCSHWSSFVEAAIKAYNPQPISPQSSVNEQIEKQFAEKGNKLNEIVGSLSEEELWHPNYYPPRSSVGVEEFKNILIKNICKNCDVKEDFVRDQLLNTGVALAALQAMTEYSSLTEDKVNQKYLPLQEQVIVLLGVCNQLNVLDAIEYVKQLQLMNKEKDREIEQLKTSLEMTQLGWSATTDKKEEWENQAKALSAIKKGLEKSYSQLQQLLSEKEKQLEYLKKRCEAAEAVIHKTNMCANHEKEYSTWTKLKQSPIN